MPFASGDFIFRYTNAYTYPLSSPYLNYSVGKDPESVRVQLDLNRPYSLVFNERCASRSICDAYKHFYAYNEKRTGGKVTNRQFNDAYYDIANLQGKFYEDTLKLGNLALPFEIGVVDEGNKNAGFDWDGVLGLGIGEDDSKSSVVKHIMRRLSVQEILWQEGLVAITKPGKDRFKPSNGTVAFGRYTERKCGAFKWYNTKDNKHWHIMADVVIDSTTYSNKTIAFFPGQNSRLPSAIKAKHIPSYREWDDADFPDISFVKNGDTYTFTRETYAHFVNRHFMPLLDNSRGDYDFGFGSSLLQDYCLKIRADSGFNRLQIGLAKQL